MSAGYMELMEWCEAHQEKLPADYTQHLSHGTDKAREWAAEHGFPGEPVQPPLLVGIDGGKKPRRKAPKASEAVKGSLEEHLQNERADARSDALAQKYPWTHRARVTGQLITDDEGKLVRIDHNLQMIMAHDDVLQHLGTNEQGGTAAWHQPPPWRAPRDAGPELTDADEEHIRVRVRDYFGGGITAVANGVIDGHQRAYRARNTWHGFRDHIDALPAWDGVPRIATCLPVEDADAVTAAMLTGFWLNLVMRVYEPGSQVDTILTLGGPQGTRKTSWCRAIGRTYKEVESDEFGRGKDLVEQCHEADVVVFDEVDAFMLRRDDQAAVKAFITRRVDKWRPSYGRNSVTRPRTFVSTATTNRREFLPDTTGNRRWHAVWLTRQLTSEELSRETMDLYLAEARDRYKAGERADHSPEFEAAVAERTARWESSIERDAISTWLGGDDEAITFPGQPVTHDPRTYSRVSLGVLLTEVPEFAGAARSKATRDRITDAMDRMPGWRRLDPTRTHKVKGKSDRVAWERDGTRG